MKELGYCSDAAVRRAWYSPFFSRMRVGSGLEASLKDSASSFCVAW